MIRTLCGLALAVAVLGIPQSFETDDLRIVNGTDAPQGKYPSQLSLQWYGTHRCGGSILNENWGMTAAHCVDGEDPVEWNVYVGSVDLLSRGESVPVSNFVIHGSFEPIDQRNDIALIRFASPLIFSDDVRAVSLPSQDQDTEGGTSATVIGWGYPHSGGYPMMLLQEVEIIVVSDPDCDSIHGGKPEPSNICAGIPGGGKGTCTGDSGGPLFVNGTQVGMVSWSVKPCTVPPYPGVYTEISHYIDWITANQN